MEFAQILGRPYWECFPKRSGPLEACLLPLVAGTKDAHETEIQLDTEEIFLSRAYAIGEGSADVLHLFENVTARKAAEQAVKRSRDAVEGRERFYRKLIEGSSDAFFVIDGTGVVTYRSESGKRLTGYDTRGRHGEAAHDPRAAGIARRSPARAHRSRHPARKAASCGASHQT
jgi:PAS domain-containing protein